ncbi:MAG: UPF0262 family protein [Alphaproteobacteria bacterium]|nr:UPF0262 family protein [Alphaproteobacteria bacterium]
MESAPQSRIATLTLIEPDNLCPTHLIQRDRETALHDLRKDSFFQPAKDPSGPYALTLSIEDNRLVFRITNKIGQDLPMLVLSLKPYRSIIKDYFLIMRSYEEALIDGKPSRIEAIDMGRRGLHNEGAGLLMERLSEKIKMDQDTARRLFTLICVLHTGTPLVWRHEGQ